MFEPPKTAAGLRIKTVHDQLIFETMTKNEPSLRDDRRGITFTGVNFPDDGRTGGRPFFRQGRAAVNRVARRPQQVGPVRAAYGKQAEQENGGRS